MRFKFSYIFRNVGCYGNKISSAIEEKVISSPKTFFTVSRVFFILSVIVV